jgi:hypothetical protein
MGRDFVHCGFLAQKRARMCILHDTPHTYTILALSDPEIPSISSSLMVEIVFPCSSVWTKDLSLNEWIGFVAAV